MTPTKLTYCANIAVAAALVAALAACESMNPFSKPETRPCPRVTVLDDAGHLTQYKAGPGRDLLDVRYSVDIAGLAGGCEYSDGEVTVAVALDLIFTRGPAATAGETMRAPYFVAVTRGGDEILAKRIFDSEIEFPENRRRAGVREEVDQFIRLLPDETGAAYEIILGLQVSEEQLDRNRGR